MLTTLRRIFGPIARRRASGFRSELLEDRTLLSSLNLTPAGALTFGGGAEVNHLAVSFDGTKYKFEDTTGTAINAIGGIAGKDTNPAANIVEFDPSMVVMNQIVINTNGGDDVVDVFSMRVGAEGLDVRANAGTDTLNVHTDIGSPGMPVTNHVLLRSETINLDGSIYVAAPSDIRFEGAVNLLSDVEIIAPGVGQAFTSTGTINGPGGLTVHAENIEFQSNVGGITPLANFEAVGPKLTLHDVTVVGDMTIITDNLVLSPPLNTFTGGGTFTVAPFSPNADILFPKAGIAVFGFSAIVIGKSDVNSITINQDIVLPVEATFIARTINVLESIDNTGHPLHFVTNNLNLSTDPILGGGDIEVVANDPGTLLTLNGQLGGQGWSNANVSVLGGAGGVMFNNAFGAHTLDFTVDVAGPVTFTSTEAVNAQGDIFIHTAPGQVITLPAGVQAPTGDLILEGDVNLTGPGTFRAGGGHNFAIHGNVTANGNDIVIRGVAGAIAHVDLMGDVTGAGLFAIDSSGASTAALVDLGGVSASNIVVRGLDVNLHGDLTSSSNVSIIGPSKLHAAVTITSGGAATNFIQFGSVDGGFDLVILGGAGRFVAGVVGGMTPLASMDVTAGGSNVIASDITVLGPFSWINAGRLINNAHITAGAPPVLVGTPFINNGTLTP